jgi:hypothetical protein
MNKKAIAEHFLNPNQPNPIPMPPTSFPIAKATALNLFKVFGYTYTIFCVIYVTLSILFSTAYQIGKFFSH